MYLHWFDKQAIRIHTDTWNKPYITVIYCKIQNECWEIHTNFWFIVFVLHPTNIQSYVCNFSRFPPPTTASDKTSCIFPGGHKPQEWLFRRNTRDHNRKDEPRKPHSTLSGEDPNHSLDVNKHNTQITMLSVFIVPTLCSEPWTYNCSDLSSYHSGNWEVFPRECKLLLWKSPSAF